MTTDSVQSSTVCSSTTPQPPSHAQSPSAGAFHSFHGGHHAHGSGSTAVSAAAPLMWDPLHNSEHIGYDLASSGQFYTKFIRVVAFLELLTVYFKQKYDLSKAKRKTTLMILQI